MKAILLAVALLAALAMPAHAQRVQLATDLTMYVAPSASSSADAGLCSSPAAPCKHLWFAVNQAQKLLDLAGYSLTIDATGGGNGPQTYTDGVYFVGAFVGQNTPFSQVTLKLGSSLIAPPTGHGNCVVVNNATVTISGSGYGGAPNCKTAQWAAGTNQADEVMCVGGASTLNLDGFVFGDAINPANDLTVNNCTVHFVSGYSLSKTYAAPGASYSPASGTLYVNSLTNVNYGMMVSGPNIPPYTYVLGVNPANNSVTINNAPTGTQSSVQVVFAAGGQNHFDLAGGAVYYDTNCGAAPFNVSFGWAGYYDAILHVANGGAVTLGANFSGNVIGYRASVHLNGVVDSCSIGLPLGTPSAWLFDTGGQWR